MQYEIVFDGGALGNPGKGYGSYEITRGGAVVRHAREEYGDNVTNNQAEYLTLILALEWLANELGSTARHATIVVNGDSRLVLNQISGKWKVKHDGLKPLKERATVALRSFKSVELVWHARQNSVQRLGH